MFRVTSVLPLKADIHQHGLHVRFVPIPDICGAAIRRCARSPTAYNENVSFSYNGTNG